MNGRRFLILPLLITPFISGATPKSPVTMNIDLQGPFMEYQNDVVVPYTVVSKGTRMSFTARDTFTFGNDEYPNAVVVRGQEYALPPYTTVNSSVTFPLSMLLGESGMHVQIVSETTSGQVIINRSFNLYPISEETINPVTMEQYSSMTLGFDIDGSTFHAQKEKFTFEGFSTYFNKSVYYRLPIEQFSFSRSGFDNTHLTYADSYMKIYQDTELFPALRFTNRMCKIPIKLVDRGGSLGIEFKNQLYVDKKTLIMSTDAMVGFVGTNRFYLPINKKRNINRLEVGFEINKVGVSQTTFKWSTTLYPDNGFVGDCQDSEYCIVGEVSQ